MNVSSIVTGDLKVFLVLSVISTVGFLASFIQLLFSKPNSKKIIIPVVFFTVTTFAILIGVDFYLEIQQSNYNEHILHYKNDTRRNCTINEQPCPDVHLTYLTHLMPKDNSQNITGNCTQKQNIEKVKKVKQDEKGENEEKTEEKPKKEKKSKFKTVYGIIYGKTFYK